MQTQINETQHSADSHAALMADFIRAGEEAAYNLENRGPIKFDPSGQLHSDILDAYWKYGFYVFEGVVGEEELAELRADVDRVLAGAPIDPEAKVDAAGRPSLDQKYVKHPYRFAKPLSDPLGGTKLNNGRHPVGMISPDAGKDAPKWTVQLLDGNLHLMDSALRLYGHAGLLKVAEAINGPDFVPYNEVAFIKEPGLGPSVAWHQDGTNHWDSADWNQGAHGFNFMTQLYPSTAANCVWVLPGSHKLGRVDIKKLVEDSGSDRIEGAVPMVCNAGDVLIMNRQIVHGSFANTSVDRRVTLNAGFFSRKRVLDVTATRLNGDVETFDADRIYERCRIIPLAVSARQEKFPDEDSFCYQPLAGREAENSWNDETRKTLLQDYNLRDMYI